MEFIPGTVVGPSIQSISYWLLEVAIATSSGQVKSRNLKDEGSNGQHDVLLDDLGIGLSLNLVLTSTSTSI